MALAFKVSKDGDSFFSSRFASPAENRFPQESTTARGGDELVYLRELLDSKDAELNDLRRRLDAQVLSYENEKLATLDAALGKHQELLASQGAQLRDSGQILQDLQRDIGDLYLCFKSMESKSETESRWEPCGVGSRVDEVQVRLLRCEDELRELRVKNEEKVAGEKHVEEQEPDADARCERIETREFPKNLHRILLLRHLRLRRTMIQEQTRLLVLFGGFVQSCKKSIPKHVYKAMGHQFRQLKLYRKQLNLALHEYSRHFSRNKKLKTCRTI